MRLSPVSKNGRIAHITQNINVMNTRMKPVSRTSEKYLVQISIQADIDYIKNVTVFIFRTCHGVVSVEIYSSQITKYRRQELLCGVKLSDDVLPDAHFRENV